VWPIFGADLEGGSQVYAFNVFKRLPGLNVETTVLSTLSASFRATSAFNLKWKNDGLPQHEEIDELSIRRFPVTLSVPKSVGKKLSRKMLRRWELEDEMYGGSRCAGEPPVDTYYRAAMERPRTYDSMTKLLRGPYSLPLIACLIRAVPRHDVVVAGFIPFTLVLHARNVARLFGKPFVFLPFFHPNDRYHYWRHFFVAMARADAVIAQSRYMSDTVFPKFGVNSTFVGGGVDWDGLSSESVSGVRFREKVGIRPGEKLILFVGRKEPGKKYQTAIEAVHRLARDARLVVVGRDVDKKPIDSPKTIHVDYLSGRDLYDAYDACDAFLLPSEHESFGIVFCEAWTRKKPVIGNASCGPIASLITDGVDGFLCRTPEEIAARLEQLFEDPSLARRMGENGYEKVRGNHTWDTVARRFREIYEQVRR
jgi:glycosyltransferase involved in cell wall biosynthesis